MKKPILFIAMLVLAVMTGPTLRADITPVNFPSVGPAGSSLTGPVTNIDPVNQMIQVKDGKGIIQTFYMRQNIQILKNGAPTPLNDLNIGDIVTITLG